MSTVSHSMIAAMLSAFASAWCIGCAPRIPQVQFDVEDLVYSVDVSEDGKLVAVGSRGNDGSGTLTVFHIDQRAKLWSADGGTWVWDVAFSPDQKWLVSGSDSGLYVWSAAKGGAAMVLPPPQDSLPEVKHLSLSPSGRFLAASRNANIEIWDFPRRQLLRTLETTGGGALAFSPDDNWLAVAGYHNRLTVFDPSTGSKLSEIHARIGILEAADFSPDGRKLAVCSEGTTKVFSIALQGDQVVLSELNTIRGGLGTDISVNGRWVASGGYTGYASISDLNSGQPITTIPVGSERDSIYATKFSPDNKQLIVGGMLGKGPERMGVVQIWNLKDFIGRGD